MKTIVEMQKELMEMSGKMGDLSKEIMEYGKEAKGESAMDYKHLKALASRYPIEGILGAVEDSKTKEQYITLLLSAIYVSSGNTDGAWLLAQRIALGGGVEAELSELAIDAQQITGEQIDDFTGNLLEEGINWYFAVDVMLLYICCEAEDERMLEFIAGILELLQIDQTKLNVFSNIAKRMAAGDLPLVLDPYPPLQNVNDIVPFGHYNSEVIKWKIIAKEGRKMLLLCKTDLKLKKWWQDAMDYTAREFYQNCFDSYQKQILLGKSFLLSKNDAEKYSPFLQDRGGYWWIASKESDSRAYYVTSTGNLSTYGINSSYAVCPAIWLEY